MSEHEKATPRPWDEPVFDSDTGPEDEGYWEWWQVASGKFDNKDDAYLAWRAVNSYDASRALIEQMRDALRFAYSCLDSEGYAWCAYDGGVMASIQRSLAAAETFLEGK